MFNLYPGSGLSFRRSSRRYGYIKPVQPKGWAALRMQGVGLTKRAKIARLEKKFSSLMDVDGPEIQETKRMLRRQYKALTGRSLLTYRRKKGTAKPALHSRVTEVNLKSLDRERKKKKKADSPGNRKTGTVPKGTIVVEPAPVLIHTPGVDPTTAKVPYGGVDPILEGMPTPMSVDDPQGVKRQSYARTLDFRATGRKTRIKIGWK